MTLPILFGLVAAVPEIQTPGPLPRLSVQGPNIVDPAGHKVILRGVNFGGWLVEEIWMLPFADNPPEGSGYPKIVDHKTLWGVVEKRLGRDAMVRVRNAWRDNWIVEEDFKRVADRGFNHVRLPFLYHLLEEEGGMERLKTAAKWAAKHRVYLMLDMHGTPGSQSHDHHTGEQGANRLWSDPKNIAKMAEVWAKLTEAFGDDPTVAVFNIMNEPMGGPNPAMIHLVHDRSIRAIRAKSEKPIVLFEDGYKGLDTTPHLEVAGWTNAVYSVHRYSFDAKDEQTHIDNFKRDEPRMVELMKTRNAPLYIGEFNFEPHSSPEVTRTVVGMYEANGWSWALWTYKTMAKNGPMGQWGLFSYPGPAEVIDAYRDSEADMIRKIKLIRTDKMREVPGVAKALVPSRD